MLCLCGFELYSRWVPLETLRLMFDILHLFPSRPVEILTPTIATWIDKITIA